MHSYVCSPEPEPESNKDNSKSSQNSYRLIATSWCLAKRKCKTLPLVKQSNTLIFCIFRKMNNNDK
ncbi:unnamed protein product [Arabidopsis halleri]